MSTVKSNECGFIEVCVYIFTIIFVVLNVAVVVVAIREMLWLENVDDDDFSDATVIRGKDHLRAAGIFLLVLRRWVVLLGCVSGTVSSFFVALSFCFESNCLFVVGLSGEFIYVVLMVVVAVLASNPFDYVVLSAAALICVCAQIFKKISRREIVKTDDNAPPAETKV